MTASDSTLPPASDREIVLTRLLDAPPKLVWEAFTQPHHVARWWGPRGFTTTTAQMDVRPGGVWRFTMHGPDGTNYPNRIDYLEVVPPQRLVYLLGDDTGDPSSQFHVTVTFDPSGAQTRLTMRMLFPSAEERDRVVREVGGIEGGNQTLDRLAEHLAAMRSQA